MINKGCIEFQNKISAYLDGTLDQDELTLFSEHISSCGDCGSSVLLANSIKTACRDLDGDIIDAPPDFHDTLMIALRSERKKGFAARVLTGFGNSGQGDKRHIRFPRPLRVAAMLLICISIGLASSILLSIYRSNMAVQAPMVADNVAAGISQGGVATTTVAASANMAIDAIGDEAFAPNTVNAVAEAAKTSAVTTEAVTTVPETAVAALAGDAVLMAAPQAEEAMPEAGSFYNDSAPAEGYDIAKQAADNNAAEPADDYDAAVAAGADMDLSPPQAPIDSALGTDGGSETHEYGEPPQDGAAPGSKPEAIMDSGASTIAAPPLRNQSPELTESDEMDSVHG